MTTSNPSRRPSIVVLDDWERALERVGDWSAIADRAELRFHASLLRDNALVQALAHADVVVLNRDRTPLEEPLLARLPALRYVVYTGPRNRRIAYAALKARGIPVSSTEGGPGIDGTCEHAWSLILACVRRLEQGFGAIRGGGWRAVQEPTPLPDVLHGETLGIVGLGNIGTRVARVALAFGMHVVAWSPSLTPERAAAAGARAVALDELLQTSKVVTLHLVPSPSTRHLVDRRALSQMRADAVLVNTSRAELVDTAALAEALRGGTIAAAALDVFDVEPLPAADALRRLPNLVATPHMGFLSEDAARAFAGGVCEAVRAWLDGRPLPRLVEGE